MLHSDIGYQSIAAKVNHKLVPLNTKLNSGDQVEILTSKEANASAGMAHIRNNCTCQVETAELFQKEEKI